jgi:Cdc6-like AAA superfamily ATPase
MPVAPDFKKEMNLPETDAADYPTPPDSQIQDLYRYIRLRMDGLSQTEASRAVKGGRPDPTPMETEAAPQPPATPEQSGSGLGMKLVENEAIYNPQGDRWKIFKHPTQILMAGATGSGKTTLLSKILAEKDRMFSPAPEEIYWFYQIPTSVEGVSLPSVILKQGAPTQETLEKITEDRSPKLIVMDDMQSLTTKKPTLEWLLELFRVGSHHRNVSVIFIVQSLMDQKMKPML